MIAGISSLLSAGALGAFLKIASALLEHWQENKKRNAELEAAKFAAHKDAKIEIGKQFYGEGELGLFTRITRRWLAIMFVGTFCGILILWAIYPGAEIFVYQPTGDTRFAILWGLASFTIRGDQQLALTTGALVWAAMHPLTMILTAYFMPIGKR